MPHEYRTDLTLPIARMEDNHIIAEHCPFFTLRSLTTFIANTRECVFESERQFKLYIPAMLCLGLIEVGRVEATTEGRLYKLTFPQTYRATRESTGNVIAIGHMKDEMGRCWIMGEGGWEMRLLKTDTIDLYLMNCLEQWLSQHEEDVVAKLLGW